MDEFPPGASPSPEPAHGERLDSWKEIASYLKRDVTTVQRWEKREGMPVHRHQHDKLGSVYAFRSEITDWARVRSLPPVEPGAEPIEGVEPAPPRGRSRSVVLLAAGAALLAALAVSRLGFQRKSAVDALDGAPMRYLTDFGGTEHAAAISRDGRFVAFLSDRDGQPDVWVTEVDSGRFRNLTGGAFPELINPSVRTIAFSPDGALVTFWTRRPGPSGAAEIGIWAASTVGGTPRPYLEGVAECDWSPDGRRLAYHTPGPGDPTFVREPGQGGDRPLLTAPPGLHAHFPLWSPDESFIYYVQGAIPGAMDVWRLRTTGGAGERVTSEGTRVTHPVLLDRRTLLYLATDADGSGPWLNARDLEAGVSRRIGQGLDPLTSLSASPDGRRLVVTVAHPKRTLWSLPLDGAAAGAPPVAIPLATANGSSPRIGPGYLLYVSSKGASDSIWKLEAGRTTEIWTAPGARVAGAPAIDVAGGRIAFTAEIGGRKRLYAMEAAGTDARVVSAALDLRGAPAWSPDGRTITTAIAAQGRPLLVSVTLDGASTTLVPEYSLDPVWSPDGAFVVYSGPDVGTTFSLKAAAVRAPHPAFPPLVLTRGARRARFLGSALVVMRGDLQHKDLWQVDLASGAERRLTTLPPGFDIRDFDISPDGRQLVLERVQERSDIAMLEPGGR